METWNEIMKQSCKSCRFYSWGSCRRYPKQNMGMTNMNSEYDQNKNQYIQKYSTSWGMGWPSVMENEWCGEWLPRFTIDKMEPTKI